MCVVRTRMSKRISLHRYLSDGQPAPRELSMEKSGGGVDEGLDGRTLAWTVGAVRVAGGI